MTNSTKFLKHILFLILIILVLLSRAGSNNINNNNNSQGSDKKNEQIQKTSDEIKKDNQSEENPQSQNVSIEPEWEKVKEKDDITVLFRTFPEDNAFEFKSWASTDATLEACVEVMKDPDKYHEWYGMTDKLIVIKKISDKKFEMHFILDIPFWPDADIVVMIELDWDYKTGTATGKIYSIDSTYRPDPDMHRIRKMNGFFLITRENEKLTKCLYELYISFGGTFDLMPEWVISLIGKKQPFDTLYNLKTQPKKAIYQDRAAKIRNLSF